MINFRRRQSTDLTISLTAEGKSFLGGEYHAPLGEIKSPLTPQCTQFLQVVVKKVLVGFQ